jgi:hypothetical protein
MKIKLFVYNLCFTCLFAINSYGKSEALKIDSSFYGEWYEIRDGYYNTTCNLSTANEALIIDGDSISFVERIFDAAGIFKFPYTVINSNKILTVRPDEDTNNVVLTKNNLSIKKSCGEYVFNRVPRSHSLFTKLNHEDFSKLILTNYQTKFYRESSVDIPSFIKKCLTSIFKSPVSIDTIIKKENYGNRFNMPDVNLYKIIISYYPQTVLSPQCALMFIEQKNFFYLLNQNEIFIRQSGIDSFAVDNKLILKDSNLVQYARLFSSYIYDTFPSEVMTNYPRKDTSSLEYKIGKSLVRSYCGEELIHPPLVKSDIKITVFTFFALDLNILYYYDIRLYAPNGFIIKRFKLGKLPGAMY